MRRVKEGRRIVSERQSDGVPFVYFEQALTYGSVPGVAKVELTASVTLGVGPRDTEVVLVPVAHLRCNPNAARMLAEALLRAAEMAEKPAPTGAMPQAN